MKTDPEQLLSEALTAPKYPELSPYFKVVLALRNRDISWRAMADWFEERGITVSHTTLRDFYRDEVMRRPEPILEKIQEEINEKSDALMLSPNPFNEEENQ